MQKFLSLCIGQTYHATEAKLLSSLVSFTVISMISMPDFSDGDRELLSITVSMQTQQGAVNARQREKETQGRQRMKKLGKTEPHVVSRETHMRKSEGLNSFSRSAWEPSWSHKHCGMSPLRVQSWPSTSHFNWVTLNVHHKSAIDSLSKLAETMTEGLQAH